MTTSIRAKCPRCHSINVEKAHNQTNRWPGCVTMYCLDCHLNFERGTKPIVPMSREETDSAITDMYGPKKEG